MLRADLPVPAWIDTMPMRPSDPIPALAMLSVGYQLRLADWRETAALAVGLGFKLVLVPFPIAPLYLGERGGVEAVDGGAVGCLVQLLRFPPTALL